MTVIIMQNQGLLRFVSICLIISAILIYNIGFFFKTLNVSSDSFITVTEISNISKNDTAKTVSETENSSFAALPSEQNNESSQAVEVSAEAVKGKIISKYISPYTAALSYDGIYLKNSTELDVDIKGLLNSPLKYKIYENNEPQVLIIHTHATETFMPTDAEYFTDSFTSRSTDNSVNMVKIGDIVAEKLNSSGIVTLHDATQHDYPQYNGSYTRAASTINSYLKKYPSIKVVLDLHRDSVSSGDDKVKLVTEIGGKKAAQVMLVMGSQSGGVTNFPNWQENLKLALRLQQTFEKKYPTLARPLSLMPKNYNESLTTGSLLIEFGTDANCLSEVHYSAELVGECIKETLKNAE